MVAIALASQAIPLTLSRLADPGSPEGGPLAAIPWRVLAAVLPALSPFVAVNAVLGARAVGWVTLLCLPVLVMAFLRGRWFCRALCPVGLLTDGVGRLRSRAARSRFTSWPKIGPWVVLLTFGGAVAGYPLLLWMDPLVAFHGFVTAWRLPIGVASLLPAAGLLCILLVSLWRPGIWCYRICPLGCSQELALGLSRSMRGTGNRDGVARNRSLGRRGFLAAIGGAAIGGFARRAAGGISIRPPGAQSEDRFGGLCCRCGNCARACPSGIIEPDLGATGVGGLLTPVVKIKPGYCREWCHECSKVCPTGAIRRISLEEKSRIVIGQAVVTKSLCLAWDMGQYCMVCDEFCPYGAIHAESYNGVNCPRVDPDICRGCGLCQTVCPAGRTAIVVEGCPQRCLERTGG